MSSHYHRSIISTGRPDSFAVEDLLSQAERVTGVIIANNTLTDHQIKSLEQLRDNIKQNRGIDRLIQGSDKKEWNVMLDLDHGHTWLDDFHHGLRISYFHRLLLDKVNYFETYKDPYLAIKQSALRDTMRDFSDDQVRNFDIDEILEGMLWGNKFDLVPPIVSTKKELVTDNRDDLKMLFASKTLNQIDIISDNAGQELFFDVIFACYIIEHKIANKIIFHLKNYPYNITDATAEDFNNLVSELSSTSRLKKFGLKLKDYVREGKISTLSYPYTTLGFDLNKAANIFKTLYRDSSLIVTKGDFNYRKNVGWYYWKTSDIYKDIISYLKSPLLCFRVIKNEILLGIDNQAQLYKLHKEDPHWWKKGWGGMILLEYPDKDGLENNNAIHEFWGKIM